MTCLHKPRCTPGPLWTDRGSVREQQALVDRVDGVETDRRAGRRCRTADHEQAGFLGLLGTDRELGQETLPLVRRWRRGTLTSSAEDRLPIDSVCVLESLAGRSCL